MCPSPTKPRAIRLLFVANDGLGSGHVTRSIAIAAACREVGRERGLAVERLLFTTAAATTLPEHHRVPTIRAPSIGTVGADGIDGARYRALTTELARAAINGFRPDLVVLDTFPAGPHRELATLLRPPTRAFLVRRTIGDHAIDEPEAQLGLDRIEGVIVPDDPTPLPFDRAVARHALLQRVAPIVLHDKPLGRRAARAELGVPDSAKVVLVTGGGGGDPESVAFAREIGSHVAHRGLVAIVAEGPLAKVDGAATTARVVRGVPLARVLSAFDFALAAAGYNTAHELAAAGVRAALFARPRSFDDQAARALRFRDAGLAVTLASSSARDVDAALQALAAAPKPRLATLGAAQTASILIDAVAGERG